MKRTRRPNMGINKPLIQSALGPNGQEQQQQQQQQQLQSSSKQPVAPSPVSDPALVPASVTAASPDVPPIVMKLEQANDNFIPVEQIAIDLSKGNGSTGVKRPFKKTFQKRKKPSEWTRAKKQLHNRRLRKSMLPKNASMVLNEVKGVTLSDFTIDSNPDGGFTAVVTVNSNQYEGQGLSKMSAKNAACENAWRDFIIAKMTPKKPNSGVESMDTNHDESESPEDDLPILSLASFAIYKLYSEWERDGYIVPEMHPSAANASGAAAGGDAAAPGAHRQRSFEEDRSSQHGR